MKFMYSDRMPLCVYKHVCTPVYTCTLVMYIQLNMQKDADKA